ncbi:TIGR03936 family radical SAM-associated protein [Maledivibacter halophilus]|uniref:Radical SAM-linked protein n=1 Tax=Maledivibacter halophilus TaxID=36842 RepID=A0A1T5KM64_9FIRM|nr:TIGR03936 family radical SAM-associated protein [Maledivibacter halophilus]SKC64575.1 radical SAM-linked protein [Maledivibacter halophilus]
MYKILAKFTKMDRMKFLSHLELIRVIERALRRANIPLRFTQGFNPHPKISFAAPLAVGVSSEGEYLTVEINKEINVKDFEKKLNMELPEGIKFIKCKYIDPKSKSLMSIVEESTYIVKCITKNQYDLKEIDEFIEKFLKREEILYKKIGKRGKEKIVNIKKYIKEIIILSLQENEIIFKTTVSTGSKGNLKPEVAFEKLMELEGIEIDLEKVRVHRLETFSSKGDKKLLPIDATI